MDHILFPPPLRVIFGSGSVDRPSLANQTDGGGRCPAESNYRREQEGGKEKMLPMHPFPAVTNLAIRPGEEVLAASFTTLCGSIVFHVTRSITPSTTPPDDYPLFTIHVHPTLGPPYHAPTLILHDPSHASRLAVPDLDRHPG
jgi:hypothetical protein